jgi:hypothetical protein
MGRNGEGGRGKLGIQVKVIEPEEELPSTLRKE